MTNSNQAGTLQTIFNDSVRTYGEKVAFTFPEYGAVTFREMGEKASEISYFLQSHHIEKGDKVALLSENRPNWGISYFGVVSMGAVIVPILIDFSVKEINSILEHSESKALFVSQKVYRRLADKLCFTGLIVIIDAFEEVYHEGKSLDSISKVVQADPKAFASYTPDRVEENDLAAIIYTSGTTGRSKGVMLTHKNFYFEAKKLRKIQDVNENDTYLSILPLAHTYECTIGLIMGVDGGAKTIYLDKAPTPAVLLPLMATYRPTIILTVPLIMEKIYKSKIKDRFTKNKFTRLLYKFRPTQIVLHKIAGKKLYEAFGGKIRFFGVGGAALAPEAELFMQDCNFPYSCGYGLTETAPLLAGSVVGSVAYRSVGMPVDDVEVKILDPNPNTGEGEIIARGPNVMVGYYKDQESTDKVLSKDGWFHTGDLGLFRDGLLYIKGRTKNLILGPSGENIYPEEIEEVLNRQEYVTDSLVYQMKGKLIARVAINQEEWIKCYQKMMVSAHIKQDEYQEIINQYLEELMINVNEEFGRYSQLSQVVLQPVPFEKTPTLKIKRYLYC